MKKLTSHSKSSLFLTEMIFVLLFLGLACSVCVQLFSASYLARKKAQAYEHVQELTLSAGEILEGTSGSLEDFQKFFPGKCTKEDTLSCYFDSSWQPSADSQAAYKMDIVLSRTEQLKTAQLFFFDCRTEEDSEPIYQLTIQYPFFEI